MILASASPRRKELLELIGVEPVVKIPKIDESHLPKESIIQFVERISREKGRSIYQEGFKDLPIISSDTVVAIDERILGKPRNRDEAFEFLNSLAGRSHRVITGIAIHYNNEVYFDSACTTVVFNQLSKNEIHFYLDHEDYADKAGAYGIQGKASVFVEKIDGCYFNVMGFPLNLFYKMLKKIGITLYSPG